MALQQRAVCINLHDSHTEHESGVIHHDDRGKHKYVSPLLHSQSQSLIQPADVDSDFIQPIEWNPSYLNDIDAVIFDCDGVLWQEDTLVADADKTLDRLLKQGKTILFCSNNSGKSRKSYIEKLKKTNLLSADSSIDERYFYSSSYASAHYLLYEASVNNKGNDVNAFDPANEAAFTVGGSGIGEELRTLGFQHVIEANTYVGTKHLSRSELINLPLPRINDKDVGAVIVGIDDTFTYTKCSIATTLLTSNHRTSHDITSNQASNGSSNNASRNKEVIFISTNQDRTLPTPGHILPGGGSIVHMISISSGRKPVNVGKPEPYMLQLAMSEHKISDSSRVLMVGDRLDTDILFGNNSGCKTLLVTESGINRRDDIAKENIYPTYVAKTVADLCKS